MGMDSGPRAADPERRRKMSGSRQRAWPASNAISRRMSMPASSPAPSRWCSAAARWCISRPMARDLEAGTPVERDTIFRIYSMTKPIVSVGLMTLYEEGRFQLDDPVAQYIPPFRGLKVLAGGPGRRAAVREPTREMTVADLLRHTSGLVSQSDTVLGDAYTRLAS